MSLGRTSLALARHEGAAWAPIVAALAIDLADFVTAGPLGLVAGLAVGGVLTATVAASAGARPRRVALLALVGGLYCALPLTEALPLATVLAVLHRALAPRAAVSSEPDKLGAATPAGH